MAEILGAIKHKGTSSVTTLTLARHIQGMITSELVEHLTCKFPESLEERYKATVRAVKDLLAAEGFTWRK